MKQKKKQRKRQSFYKYFLSPFVSQQISFFPFWLCVETTCCFLKALTTTTTTTTTFSFALFFERFDVLLSEILRIHHGAPLLSGQDVVEVIIIDQPKTKKSAPPFDRKDVPNVHLVSRRHALLLRDISSDRRYASRDVGENAQVWTSSSSSSGRRE